MDFASIEQHLARFAQSAEASVAEHATAFVAWLKGEEQGIATEIAHLKDRGYQVLKDGVQL